MERRNIIVSVDLGEGLKDKLKIAADARGSSLSKLVKNAVSLYLGFDEDFIGKAHELADDMKIIPSVVIERLALAHMVEMKAKEEATGTPMNMLEFIPGLTAKEFCDFWRGSSVN